MTALTSDLLVAAFSAAGVTGDNVGTIIPLAVVVAQQVSAAAVTPQQFASFAAKAIVQQVAAATAQKAQLTQQAAALATQIAALGV
jgi:hypothetical protein